MTENEKKLIDAAISGERVHDAALRVAAERVSRETLNRLVASSKLAMLALDSRTQAAEAAFTEAGMPVNRFGSSNRYNLLVELLGTELANLQ